MVGWGMRWAALMVAGVTLLGLGARAAQGPAAGIQGVVVSGDGLPVAGAEVESGGGVRATTDAEGRFFLPIAEWPATLTVRARGFAPLTRQVARPGAVQWVLAPAPLAESVTVAATARNQAVTAVPILTQVAGAGRLAAQAPVNLDSLLREFPALSTYRRATSLNSHPTTQGVSLLGLGTSGASRALVLRDGLPLNDPFGGWIDWLRVPAASIAELSVVEGGASPLYGSSALAGVVDVTSKPPNAPQVAVRAGGGGQGTASLDSFSALGGGVWAPALAGAVDTPAGVTAQDWQPELRWAPEARGMVALGGEYFGERRGNGTALE